MADSNVQNVPLNCFFFTFSSALSLINQCKFWIRRWRQKLLRVNEDSMQTLCIKTKLKRGALEDVRRWFQTLKLRMGETLKSLANERVVFESAFLDKQGDDYFLIYYLKAHDINYVYEVFDTSTLAIDQYFKKCWTQFCEGREVLEELLDIDRIGAIEYKGQTD